MAVLKKAIIAAAIFTTGTANAVVIGAEASAGGVRIDVSVVTAGSTTTPVNLGPLPTISDTAPPAFSEANNQAGFSSGPVGGSLSVDTGLLVNMIGSNVDGGLGPRSVMSMALVNDLDFATGLVAAIGFTADSVSSNAMIVGDIGSLMAMGSTILANAVLNVAGTPTAIANNPAPNTEILNAGGISITLNEQTLLGDGITNQVLNVAAIHIRLNSFVLGAATISGDVFVAESNVQLQAQAVPLPSSMWLLATALIGFGLRGKRVTART